MRFRKGSRITRIFKVTLAENFDSRNYAIIDGDAEDVLNLIKSDEDFYKSQPKEYRWISEITLVAEAEEVKSP